MLKGSLQQGCHEDQNTLHVLSCRYDYIVNIFASPLAFVLSGGQQQCLDLIRTINVIICHEQQENAQSLPFIDDKSRKNALTPFCEQRMHKDPVALRMKKQKTLSEECTVSAL